jgi:hypothetical protein
MRFFKRDAPELARTEPIEDRWEVSEGEYKGQPIVTRFNAGAVPLAGKSPYKIQIGVAVPLRNPNESGMPTDEEMAELAGFEEGMIQRADKLAILVGVITTAGMREFVLYTASAEWIASFHQDLRAALPTHEVQVQAQKDRSWNVYREFVSR